MVGSSARKVILPTVLEMEVSEGEGENYRSIPNTEISYYFTDQIQRFSSPIYQFPVVLSGDNSPWLEANLYLLQKLENDLEPTMATYSSIADDLVMFKRFIDEQCLDFRVFPEKKFKRPTYRFRADLKISVDAGLLKPSTAKRRMSAIINFYRWLGQEGLVHFEHPPWRDSAIRLQFADAHGVIRTHHTKTTDLAVRTQSLRSDFDDHILDGGRLRPLSLDEQRQLIRALKEVNNIEMSLIFLIAMLTGARIQTVLTLRKDTITGICLDGRREFPVLVGRGTSVDTKNNKQMLIYFPSQLVLQLKTYIGSERFQRRSAKRDKKILHEYLFLTKGGKPYYLSKADIFQFGQRSIPRGGAIREFITSRILPFVSFKFSFHDLRATYGLNLTEQQLASVELGETTLHKVRLFVRDRMGHKSLLTTDRYLSYKNNFGLTLSVQSLFEENLLKEVFPSIE